MNKLNNIPRSLLVFLVLLSGALFIYFANPPQSHCDFQVEVFKHSLKSVIYPPSEKATSVTSLYQRSVKSCEEGNSPGACLEFINASRQIIASLNVVQDECFPKVAELAEVQFHIKKTIKELSMLAWGESPPDEGGNNHFRWLDSGELSIYCQFKNLYLKTFEEESWFSFVNEVAATLPNASGLNQNEIFSKSIFSVRCDSIN